MAVYVRGTDSKQWPEWDIDKDIFREVDKVLVWDTNKNLLGKVDKVLVSMTDKGIDGKKGCT